MNSANFYLIIWNFSFLTIQRRLSRLPWKTSCIRFLKLSCLFFLSCICSCRIFGRLSFPLSPFPLFCWARSLSCLFSVFPSIRSVCSPWFWLSACLLTTLSLSLKTWNGLWRRKNWDQSKLRKNPWNKCPAH